MAKRILFMKKNSEPFNEELEIEFDWAPGLNAVCRQRSIDNLQKAAGRIYPCLRILDTSYVSGQKEGVGLSSSNLSITLASGESIPLESAYQGSKMINNMGPYTDLYYTNALKVKSDPRLNGEVTGFHFEGVDYSAKDPHAFYNWLFCRALSENPELSGQLEKYDAYSNIMVPVDAEECEARAAAVYEGLRISGKLALCLDNFDTFCNIVNGEELPVEEINEDSETVKNDSIETAEQFRDESLPPVSNRKEAPTSEAFKEILEAPGLKKILPGIGRAFGFKGTAKERTESVIQHLSICYENALSTKRLVEEENCLTFSADNMIKVDLTPCEKYDSGWALFFHTNTKSTNNATTVMLQPSVLKNEMTPALYLKGHGYNIMSQCEPEPALVVKLARQMRDVCSSEIGNGFLENIRKNMKYDGVIYYSFSSEADRKEKNSLDKLILDMNKLGLLRKAYFNSQKNLITYSVPEVNRIKEFLRGGWLETAILDDVKRIVNEFSRKYDLPAHIAGNLQLEQITNPGVITHELDTAFTIGDIFFVCEAKTGQADYERFRIVGKDLDVLPDRLLLVNSSLTPEEAETVTWWYPYHVAAGADMEKALRNMIQGELDKAGYIPNENNSKTVKDAKVA